MIAVVHFGDDSGDGKEDTAACPRSGEQQSSVIPGHGEGGQGRGLSQCGRLGTECGLGSQDEVSVGGSVPVGVLQEAQPRPLHSNSFLSPLFLSQ